MALQYATADERFNLPENLHIIGTNTADRSIAVADQPSPIQR